MGMQNIRFEVIDMAFRVYDINENAVPRPPILGYLSEIVNKRNDIAHGNVSPAEYGVMRSGELKIRYDAIYEEAIYVFECVNKYAASKRFVATRHRSKY
jgi:hypothetical protein